MSEKQRNKILEQAEASFQNVLQYARQALDVIDANAETMDAASGTGRGDLTAYETVMMLFNAIHATSSVAMKDLCSDILNYAVQARKDAD